MKYNDEIFDRMVRTTLQSGEEDVPEAMWEGILARLEKEKAAAAAPAPSRRLPWWGIFIPVAIAASVVSAVILLHPAGDTALPPQTACVQVIAADGAAAAQDGCRTVDCGIAATQNGSGDAGWRAAAPQNGCRTADCAVSGQTVCGTCAGTASDGAIPTDADPADTAPADSAPAAVPDGSDLSCSAVLLSESSVDAGRSVPDATADTSASAGEASGFRTNSEGVEFPEETAPGRSYISSIQLSVNGNAGNNMGENSLAPSRRASSSVNFPSGESLSEKENIYYGLPLSAGLGVKFNLKGRWALGVGLNYTFLDRRFKANYSSGAVETFEYSVANTQHYIGIPVNLYYNFAMPDRLKFYAFAGAAFEKNVGCKYSFDYEGSPKVLTRKVGGIQSSAAIGLGIQFSLTDHLCLYLDPSLRYFFPSSSQPRSVRTVQPCQINLEFGLRFDL